MRRRFLALLLLVLSLLLPLGAAAGVLDIFSPQSMGFVPRTANNIAKQLDDQLLGLLLPDGYGRNDVTITCTVPVSLDNLKHTAPLARQMSEELARYLVAAGYRVSELRQGDEVLMVPKQGEFILTRDVKKLLTRNVATQLVLAGTYTLTDQSMRFNIRLLHSASNEVVAMASGTIPITEELAPLISDPETPPPLQPTVRTRLP